MEELRKEFYALMNKVSDVNRMSLSEYREFLDECICDMSSMLHAAEADEEEE